MNASSSSMHPSASKSPGGSAVGCRLCHCIHHYRNRSDTGQHLFQIGCLPIHLRQHLPTELDFQGTSRTIFQQGCLHTIVPSISDHCVASVGNASGVVPFGLSPYPSPSMSLHCVTSSGNLSAPIPSGLSPNPSPSLSVVCVGSNGNISAESSIPSSSVSRYGLGSNRNHLFRRSIRLHQYQHILCESAVELPQVSGQALTITGYFISESITISVIPLSYIGRECILIVSYSVVVSIFPSKWVIGGLSPSEP